MKAIYCRDLERDCNAKMRGKTEDDVINATINHSVSMHGEDQKAMNTDEMRATLAEAIKEEEE